MRTSPWLSGRLARLNARERRVVGGGAVLVALLLGGAAARPVGERWSDREAAIAAKAEQVARLEALVASEPTLRAHVEALREARTRYAGRLLRGATPAVATSELQTVLRAYAEASGVSLQRVDPERSAALPVDGLARVDLTLSARGDIYGLVELLSRVQDGEKLLLIDELSVSGPGAFRRDEPLLLWTMRLHGFHPAPEDAS